MERILCRSTTTLSSTINLQYPGPQDTAGVIREVHDSKEAVFTISADISAAHRRVKIRREDWRLLACRSDASSKVIWVNKVGTFGISSAPLWWTRTFLVSWAPGHAGAWSRKSVSDSVC